MNQTSISSREITPDVSIRRCVLLIIDGLGDLPIAELAGQTPLEAASTPLLDQLASEGLCGLVDPIIPGEIPNTHSGTGMLMGMLPEQAGRLHRGPVEASGAGRVLASGEIALRANFASIEQDGNSLLVTDRRAGRISTGTAELTALFADVDLGDNVHACLLSTDQHRASLILSGPGLDARVSNTDPGDSKMPATVKTCLALQPEAEFTAAKVNRFVELAYQRLHQHPINRARKAEGKALASGIITRGAGAQFELDNVLHNFDIRAAVVSGCNTVLGLGRIFAFTALSDPRFSATVTTDLDAKIGTAISALQGHEMIFLHVKAPDLCSHDRQPLAKRDFLKKLDKAMQPLLDIGAVIALAADHTTDSNSGFHTADPIPALIWAPDSDRIDIRVNFSEKVCAGGTMARQLSNEYLLRVLGIMGYKA